MQLPQIKRVFLDSLLKLLQVRLQHTLESQRSIFRREHEISATWPLREKLSLPGDDRRPADVMLPANEGGRHILLLDMTEVLSLLSGLVYRDAEMSGRVLQYHHADVWGGLPGGGHGLQGYDFQGMHKATASTVKRLG